MNKFVLLSVFSAIFFCNCRSGGKEVSGVHQVVHSVYNMDDLTIGYGGYMIATQDHHLVGLDYNDDFFFFRQEVNHPELLYCFGKKGQGPDEFIHPFSLQYLNDDLIASYDMFSRQFSEITLNPHAIRLKVKTLSFTSMMNFKIIKTAYGQYIGIGAYPDGMFQLYDSLGHEIKSFFEYPYRDADEKKIKNPVRAMAYQGKVSANLSGTKFAYAASYADIIHFYNIMENDIQLIQKIEARFCEYVPDERDGGIAARTDPDNKNGCVDLYATDQYVYCLYSGKTFRDEQEKAFEGNRLRIYGWSGDLFREVTLDVPCKFLCVSPDDKIMWAIAEIPEPTIVQFDLTK
jgi:hypothetical protein